VARLAGIGWIGKNRLLITPDHGPRVALATVLTDAPLHPTAATLPPDGCGPCNLCIRACPVLAYRTESFGETDSLQGFDTGRCSTMRGVINPTSWGVCGLCVQVCPYGRRNSAAGVPTGGISGLKKGSDHFSAPFSPPARRNSAAGVPTGGISGPQKGSDPFSPPAP
jgi:ferredoxin